jgi:hypothetical protein
MWMTYILELVSVDADVVEDGYSGIIAYGVVLCGTFCFDTNDGLRETNSEIN